MVKLLKKEREGEFSKYIPFYSSISIVDMSRELMTTKPLIYTITVLPIIKNDRESDRSVQNTKLAKQKTILIGSQNPRVGSQVVQLLIK